MQQQVVSSSGPRSSKGASPKARPNKEREISHHCAGEKLFMLRRSKNLKFREIQAITRQIAGRHGLADFQICPSRLKGLEGGEIPSLYKLYSLSVVYGIAIDELLGWYRVPPTAEERDLRLAERVKERLSCQDEVTQ